jgi:hypothetical protein
VRELYQADTYQLVHAGIVCGHHNIPLTVAEHPMVFFTLTAPSFGALHTANPATLAAAGRCRPPQAHPRCRHERPAWCSTIHTPTDPLIGEPLCPDCYDYPTHVLFAPVGLIPPALLAELITATAQVVSVDVASAGGEANYQEPRILHHHPRAT